MNRSEIRRQATLFLRENDSVESVRREFNPRQAELIGAHVTLIREDEAGDWDEIARRIRSIGSGPVTLGFGPPERDGDLVLVRCVSPGPFDALRAAILDAPRAHGAHVTLIHPRNGNCDDAVFEEIVRRVRPFECVFDEIAFIRQTDGGPWRILERFRL